MRLSILESGHGKRNRIALRVMRAVAGAEPDDVIKTSMYRPRFFGAPWIALLRGVMRGKSEWTPGERELFAAFTSRLNACRFCVGIHVGTAALAFDKSITIDKLDQWRDAGFMPRITAMLGLLEKVTLQPAEVTAADTGAVLAAGVSEAALVDALHVCFLFNLVNRLANALGYDFGTEADRIKLASILDRIGYALPGFLLR